MMQLFGRQSVWFRVCWVRGEWRQEARTQSPFIAEDWTPPVIYFLSTESKLPLYCTVCGMCSQCSFWVCAEKCSGNWVRRGDCWRPCNGCIFWIWVVCEAVICGVDGHRPVNRVSLPRLHASVTGGQSRNLDAKYRVWIRKRAKLRCSGATLFPVDDDDDVVAACVHSASHIGRFWHTATIYRLKSTSVN